MLKIKSFIVYILVLTLCFSCKDTSKDNSSASKTTNTIQKEKTVQIPMHGTGENSSSSSNKRFEMNKETQEMIQNPKKEE